MKKILISLMIILLFFVMGSCGGDDTEGKFKPSDCIEKFPNYQKGLCWSDASSDAMNWNEAIEYCKNLGGKLPTVSELRTLIQNCPATETGGECGVTDNCLSIDCWNNSCEGCEKDESGKYSVFGDIYYFWSSSERPDRADYIWLVDFYNGYVKNDSYWVANGNVRCVVRQEVGAY
jgi:hypothetical protein